jgi:hypothetical protein
MLTVYRPSMADNSEATSLRPRSELNNGLLFSSGIWTGCAVRAFWTISKASASLIATEAYAKYR